MFQSQRHIKYDHHAQKWYLPFQDIIIPKMSEKPEERNEECQNSQYRRQSFHLDTLFRAQQPSSA
jgi:hypothetical protein